MARPCSAQRLALLDALAHTPEGTSRQLARLAGLSFEEASETLKNMTRKGVPQTRVLRYERVPGCKRPVPVYGRLDPATVPAGRAGGGLAEAFGQLGLALFGGQAEVYA